ncbi:MAG: hypothetical protein WCS96_06585 [Victivallales bacterium]
MYRLAWREANDIHPRNKQDVGLRLALPALAKDYGLKNIVYSGPIYKSMVVSNPQVPKPVAVRYAWAENPVCNLYNSSDLPASPFRTDNWPGITK